MIVAKYATRDNPPSALGKTPRSVTEINQVSKVNQVNRVNKLNRVNMLNRVNHTGLVAGTPAPALNSMSGTRGFPKRT